MIYTEFTASLRRLHLSQAEFARLVGVDSVTVWRWTKGDRAIPAPVIAVVNLLMVLPKSTVNQFVVEGLPKIVFTPEEILGVALDAPAEQKKKKWRDLAKKLHPDKGGKVENMQRVNVAYKKVCA